MSSGGGGGAVGDLGEISQLVVRERQSRVRHLAEELAACFHPDATVTTSWLQGSAAQFVASSGPRGTVAGPILNRAGPPIVHARERRAVVELPSTTTRWIPVAEVEAELTSYMRLLYRVEKRDAEWRISDLSAINEGDALRPAIPGQTLSIDGAQLGRLRHSYRFLAYTRALRGEQVSDELFGTDRPGPVDELYGRAFAWLEEPAPGPAT